MAATETNVYPKETFVGGRYVFRKPGSLNATVTKVESATWMESGHGNIRYRQFQTSHGLASERDLEPAPDNLADLIITFVQDLLDDDLCFKDVLASPFHAELTDGSRKIELSLGIEVTSELKEEWVCTLKTGAKEMRANGPWIREALSSLIESVKSVAKTTT